MKPYKFGTLQNNNQIPFVYQDIYGLGKTTGSDRLIIAPSTNHIETMLDLIQVLPEPFGVLYVLLVSRCNNDIGRYQCPYPVSRKEMEIFFQGFKDYFESDARHHIWVTSLPASTTLVYDNHNVIYAYGVIEKFKTVLSKRGLRESKVEFPVPHTHNYNPEFDLEEREIIAYWDWRKFPLVEDVDT